MPFKNLDLNLLRIFDAVMQEGSLTKAASRLAMTQPAVSNAMSRLRSALDDDLVVRSGYGVQPTQRARALWPTVRSALQSIEDAVSPRTFDPSLDKTSFTLAMADATATALVPPVLRTIERAAPHVSLRVRPLMTRDPRDLLESGEVNVAVGYFPVASPAIRLHLMQDDMPDLFGLEHLYRGPYICVMRQGHPLAASPELSLDDFCAAHHLLVSYSGNPFDFADRVLAEMGRARRVVLTVNQFFTAGQVVINSDLLAVLPAHFLPATGFASRLVVRRPPIDLGVAEVDAVWLRQSHRDPAHEWLIRQLVRAAREAFADSPDAQPVGR
ncbi:MAG: LysR family transcriptional regulator [Burkholderiaceae bacterium]